MVKNKIARAIVERIVRAGREGKRFRIVVVIPEVPGFAGQGELALVVPPGCWFDLCFSQGRDVGEDDHGWPVPHNEPWRA